MKKLKVTDQSLCMNCLACEWACSTAFYKDRAYGHDLSCIKVDVKDNGDLKTKVCVQCGKCAKNCEAGAISQNPKGVYMINKKLCTNCGKCVEVCPFGLIVKAEDKDSPSKCIACGICAKAVSYTHLDVYKRQFPFSHLLLSIITHFSAATNASSVFSLVMKITDRVINMEPTQVLTP